MVRFLRGSAGIAFILALFSVFPYGAFAQESAATQPVPQMLRRPERGEAPRYPWDLVIGELGQGTAAGDAYQLARRLAGALVSGNREDSIFERSPSLFPGSLLDEIGSIKPRTFRLGGGRTELDGSASFVVRFIGAEESITGEIFLRREEAAARGGSEGEPPAAPGEEIWFPDDILLENKRNNSEITDNYRFDFSPYERFY